METVSHVSDVSQPELIAVATGHAAPSQPYIGKSAINCTFSDEVAVSPNYLAYQDRLTGAQLYRRTQPIEMCENDDQRTGWREERDWYEGQAAYMRALEMEDCPSEWATSYSGGRPLDFDTNW